MSEEEELVELPSGEVKHIEALTPDEATAFCEWLLEKAERAHRQSVRVAAGSAPLCDYWDTQTRSFCDERAVLVGVLLPKPGITDPPTALCERHRILAM
jgi:hypothetical protein